MGAEGIFLASGGGLVVMGEQPYASEAVLQRALEEHPEVIAGSSTTDSRAGQLILVKREMGVPGSEGGSSTWSLDHLFLDAQGVPVVVEVKRSSDTRIRREVVGQMLDYAANGVRYWPIENIKAAVESTAQAQGRSADNAIEESSGLDPEEYWNLVEANLRAGRIRMLFVADALPPELVRIIEFLNEQMSPAEVLGVELRQYVGGEHVAYVPSVVGRTTAAVKLKTTTRGEQWSEESLLEASQARCSEPEVGPRAHITRPSWSCLPPRWRTHLTNAHSTAPRCLHGFQRCVRERWECAQYKSHRSAVLWTGCPLMMPWTLQRLFREPTRAFSVATSNGSLAAMLSSSVALRVSSNSMVRLAVSSRSGRQTSFNI